MTTAEKWAEFDNLLYHKWTYRGDFTIQGISKSSREAFKSALKARIEEYYKNVDAKKCKDGDAYEQGLADAYETVLTLIEEVGPPKQQTP